jgi:hypothetical protein
MTEARIASRFEAILVKVFYCANGGKIEVEPNRAVTKIISVPEAGLGKNVIQAIVDLRIAEFDQVRPGTNHCFPG